MTPEWLKPYRRQHNHYLKSARWQKKKTEFLASLERDTCEICATTPDSIQFHVHHVSYDNLGNEPLSDLMWVCCDCHRLIHLIKAANPWLTLRQASEAVWEVYVSLWWIYLRPLHVTGPQFTYHGLKLLDLSHMRRPKSEKKAARARPGLPVRHP